MFRFVSITLRTFPCLLYCLTTHEKPRRYRWGSGAANSLKVWKVFRKTLRGFWSNIHLLQTRRLNAGAENPTLWPPDAKNSVEKTLKLGKIEGGRRRGRQRMNWLDSISNAMDMTLPWKESYDQPR